MIRNEKFGLANFMTCIDIQNYRANLKLFWINRRNHWYLGIFEKTCSGNSVPFLFEFVKHESGRECTVPCQKIIGSFIYLMIVSRNNLPFAVVDLSEHLESPTKFHSATATRALCYLKIKQNCRILDDGNNCTIWEGLSDTDWPGPGNRFVVLVRR